MVDQQLITTSNQLEGYRITMSGVTEVLCYGTAVQVVNV